MSDAKPTGAPIRIVHACGHAGDFLLDESDPYCQPRLQKCLRRPCPACRAAALAAAEADLAGRRAARLALTYQQITDLSGNELSRAVCALVTGKEFAPGRSKVAYATTWAAFGKLCTRLARAGVWFRCGCEPRHGDFFFSVRVGEEWLGMRGHLLPLAAAKAALMLVLGAWPPASAARAAGLPPVALPVEPAPPSGVP